MLNSDTMNVNELHASLQNAADKQKAQVMQRFFKTGPGQYGEGDLFLGITVPELRELAKQVSSPTTSLAVKLLKSNFHEERLLALLLLIKLYSTGTEAARRDIYELYLSNTASINNWDLVDASAPHIVGDFLMQKSKAPLYRLARSANLWERRIAIISTAHFIKRNEFSDTLKISKSLLSDSEDLIHKAVGWMLREVGKRDNASAERFLRENYKKMPRTMLRYAIERLPESKRQAYLKGNV